MSPRNKCAAFITALAAAFGLAALVRASGTAFTVLKLVGAAYLVYLGITAIVRAGRGADAAARAARTPTALVAFARGRSAIS